jgi:hypothetical protein
MEMIGSLQSGLAATPKDPTGKQRKNALEYMRMVKDTKDYILDMHTRNLITDQEKKDLNKKLTSVVSTETTTGVEDISVDRSWFNPGNWANFSYDDARIRFDKGFNGNIAKRNAAMKEYFYAVEDEGMSRKDRRTKVDDIIDRVNGKFREATVAQMEATVDTIPKDVSNEEYIKARGISEVDITTTMKANNMTREQVIDRLRGN